MTTAADPEAPPEQDRPRVSSDIRATRTSFLARPPLRTLLRRLASIAALLTIDVCGLALGLYLALVLRWLFYEHELPLWGVPWAAEEKWLPFLTLITILVFWQAGLYAEREHRAGVGRVVSSLVLVAVITLVFAWGVDHQFGTYGLAPTAVVTCAAIISVLRASYERLTRDLMHVLGVRRRAVLVGRGQNVEHLLRTLGDTRGGIDYAFVGAISPTQDGIPIPRLGSLDDLGGVLEGRRVDELIVNGGDVSDEQLVELVEQAHQRGVQVRVAPTTAEILTQRAEYVPGQAVPLFELRPPVFAGVDWATKRLFDLAVSSVVFIVGLPIWLLIAAAIKLDSRGPVLYRDRRIGLGEREFGMIKFRTMRAGAEHLQDSLETQNEASGPLFKIRDDPRVTRVGALLRALSLDEVAASPERVARRDEPRRPAPAADPRLPPARAVAPQALPRAAGDHRPLADLRPLGAHVRRPGAARLLLPGELVDLARRDDPAEDDPRGLRAQRRVLSIHPTARGFEPAAEVYEQARPDYPCGARSTTSSRCSSSSRARSVVDVGAGTGKFARQLVAARSRA